MYFRRFSKLFLILSWRLGIKWIWVGPKTCLCPRTSAPLFYCHHFPASLVFFGCTRWLKSSLSFFPPDTENALQLIKALQAHNKYRTLHHSPPLNWSQGLAAEANRIAQRLATQSMLVGKQDSALNLGQNLAKLAGWCKGNKWEKRSQAMWTQVTPASWCSHYRKRAHNYITWIAVRYSHDMYTRTPHREAALTCGNHVDWI